MSHDAVEQSLAARIRSLGFAPDLAQVLAELAERTETQPPQLSDGKGSSPHDREYEDMLDRARGAGPLRGQHAKPRLTLIPGGLAAIGGVAALGLRWVGKSATHQAIATVVTAAVVGAAAAPVSARLMPARAPVTQQSRHARREHATRGYHGPPPVPAPGPVLSARADHAAAHARTQHRRAGVSDKSAAPASPSPAATDPAPSPSPSPTPTVPLPTPTSTGLPGATGTGGPVRVIVVRGGPGRAWPNMLQHGRGNDAP